MLKLTTIVSSSTSKMQCDEPSSTDYRIFIWKLLLDSCCIMKVISLSWLIHNDTVNSTSKWQLADILDHCFKFNKWSVSFS